MAHIKYISTIVVAIIFVKCASYISGEHIRQNGFANDLDPLTSSISNDEHNYEQAHRLINKYNKFLNTITLNKTTPCGPLPWIPFKNEKCFAYYDETAKSRISYDSAESFCNGLDTNQKSRLAEIKSRDEQEFIANQLYNSKDRRVYDDVWIGARSFVDNGGVFLWSGDNSTVKYTNWNQNYPGNISENNCLMMSAEGTARGRWENVNCHKRLYFICQKFQLATLSDVQAQLYDFRLETRDGIHVINDAMKKQDISVLVNEMQLLRNNHATLIGKHAELMKDYLSVTTRLTALESKQQNFESRMLALESVQGSIKDKIDQHDRVQKTNLEHLSSIELNDTLFESRQAKCENRLGQIDKQIKKLDEKSSVPIVEAIPVGYIYAQLSGQRAPHDIWRVYKWTDISAQYAGLFFRVVGGASAHFGATQGSSSPRIFRVNSYVNKHGGENWHADLNPGSTSKWLVIAGWFGSNTYINFETNNDEVRPKNQAVIIWRRDG